MTTILGNTKCNQDPREGLFVDLLAALLNYSANCVALTQSVICNQPDALGSWRCVARKQKVWALVGRSVYGILPPAMLPHLFEVVCVHV